MIYHESMQKEIFKAKFIFLKILLLFPKVLRGVVIT